MTDPKTSESQSEELSLDQLKDAAGGIVHPSFRTSTESRGIVHPSFLGGAESEGVDHPRFGNRLTGSAGPDGSSLLKKNIAGSAQPGADGV